MDKKVPLLLLLLLQSFIMYHYLFILVIYNIEVVDNNAAVI